MVDLASLNTLAIAAHADALVELNEAGQIPAILQQVDGPWVMLGGGSNVVFVEDFPGTVLVNRIKGLELLKTGGGLPIVRVGAGENWHHFVMRALDRGWFGLENLAFIPGTVGAAPIQNIGAYGVEVNRFIHQVHAYDVQTQCEVTLWPEQCEFAYRDSVFKQNPGRWIITYVDLCLSTEPLVWVAYGELRERFKNHTPTPRELAEVVISIRQSKLPDPAQEPNVGSFFKNPVLTPSAFAVLQQTWPEVPYFDVTAGIKVPAAALIERAGWRGRGLGPVKVSERHALVLINQGGTGADVIKLAEQIQHDIEKQFGVSLEIEPVLITGNANGCPSTS